MIYPAPQKNGLPTFRTTRPGVRKVLSYAGAIFMRGRNPNPTENNCGKQGKSICTPAKRLLGTGAQTPEKRRHRRPFLSPLTGRLHVLRAFQTQEVPLFPVGKAPRIQRPPGRVAAPPVECSQGSASDPCRGIGGGPQQADFSGFRGGEKRENRKVCTTLPCLPLLFEGKRA